MLYATYSSTASFIAITTVSFIPSSVNSNPYAGESFSVNSNFVCPPVFNSSMFDLVSTRSRNSLASATYSFDDISLPFSVTTDSNISSTSTNANVGLTLLCLTIPFISSICSIAPSSVALANFTLPSTYFVYITLAPLDTLSFSTLSITS